MELQGRGVECAPFLSSRASRVRDFRYSFLVTAICLVLAAWWGAHTADGLWAALLITVILGILEVSLSFDNAVVNARVLRDMDEWWRQMFLTVGILIAVFGMRLVFPIVIVAVATGLGALEVIDMALESPKEYSRHLMESHVPIAAFGGMFLLLVFLNFLIDADKDTHWFGPLERRLSAVGRADSVNVGLAILALLTLQGFLPPESRMDALVAGAWGILLYVGVGSLDVFFENPEDGAAAVQTVRRSGAAGFIYLEVLDASFSFDGVIGAFAITQDVVIIMLGLAIGAMFVRSMTVHLVNRGTLDKFIYLEHGAHYAIGILAVLMLVSTFHHVPEVFTGLAGVVLIALSIWSSLLHRRRQTAPT